MDGVLNILKPPGMTSHDVVSFVRRTLGTKRVGHTGTLDPAAAGVLPVCVGQATRLVEYLQGGTKEYIAEATFGYETDTCDAVGKIVSQGDVSLATPDSLQAALDSFCGTITQTPPMHSAIKVGGKKLYELARDGETNVVIPTREVDISSLVVTDFWQTSTGTRAMIRIGCSGGTYIRSLVRDIGRELGCGATMTFLVRTENSNFHINDARALEEIDKNKANALLSFREALKMSTEHEIIDDEMADRLGKGQQIEVLPTFDLTAKIAVWNKDFTTAAIAAFDSDSESRFKPEKVFFFNTKPGQDTAS